MPDITKPGTAKDIEARTAGRVRVSYDALRDSFLLITHTRARAYATRYAGSTSALRMLTDLDRGYVRWLPWTGTQILPQRGRSIRVPVTFDELQP